MDNTTPAKNKKATAEFRLKIIDVFFAAYGAFISGLFCIAQYFWGSTDYFVWIASGFFFVTLLVMYVLSYSKRTTKSEYLLRYVQECANKVGFLNPFMLALGFILTITADFYILIVCIALEVTQLCSRKFIGLRHARGRGFDPHPRRHRHQPLIIIFSLIAR